MNRMLLEIWIVKAILVSGRNEEQVIGNRRKGDLYYKVAKQLADL